MLSRYLAVILDFFWYKKIKFKILAFLIPTMLCISEAVNAKDYTKYISWYRKNVYYTHEVSFPCNSFTNRNRFNSALRSIGWPESNRVSNSIDFTKRKAVLIANSSFSGRDILTLTGVHTINKEIHVHYKREYTQPSTQEAPNTDINQDRLLISERTETKSEYINSKPALLLLIPLRIYKRYPYKLICIEN